MNEQYILIESDSNEHYTDILSLEISTPPAPRGKYPPNMMLTPPTPPTPPTLRNNKSLHLSPACDSNPPQSPLTPMSSLNSLNSLNSMTSLTEQTVSKSSPHDGRESFLKRTTRLCLQLFNSNENMI